MHRPLWHGMLTLISIVMLALASASHSRAQNPQISKSPEQTPSGSSPTLAPMEDAATVAQIQEYLKLSGDLDSFRSRWVAGVDRNRSIGAPYWPESFWTALKHEMNKTDLMPMYIALFQHGVSKSLMQEVLDAYHTLGAEHYPGSSACFKLDQAEVALVGDMNRLKLEKTQEVIRKVYAMYKPQIKAARERYMAEHPGWVDK